MAVRVPHFLQVRCPTGTLRRAGLPFGKDFTIIESDELTAEQVVALTNEPALEVCGSEDGETYTVLAPIEAASQPAAPSPESELAAGMAGELTGAVSAVLSRFAPDMEVAPGKDESPFATVVRLLGQLVTHETPCDKRIASLETELSSTKSQLSSANGTIETLTKQRDDAVAALAEATKPTEAVETPPAKGGKGGAKS